MNLSKIISTITISFFLLFFNNVMGQYEIDQQGTVNNCSANFHDSDSTGNYLDNETYIMTICTDGSGNSLNIGFGTMFDIDPSDTLYVYEGATTASPLIGAYNNNNILAGVATPTSGDGCLTFKFVSDGAVNGQGWIAIVNCLTICQPVDAIITTTPSTVNYGPDSNYTNICVGDTVQFSVTGNYPDATANSGSYAQSDANTTFDWEFGNGSVDVGTNVNSTYMNEQGYLVILTVTDVNGCIETVRHKIRTGITPEFAGVFASPDISCFEDSVSLIGGFTQTIGQNSTVTVDTGYVSAGGIVSGQTYLPDGNGNSYTTSVNISGFSGQTIANGSDITTVCTNIEHSYIGDLDMTLTCPNGTTITLMDTYGGAGPGNTFLGDALDNVTTPPTPGNGLDYCFDLSATWGTMTAENVAGNYIASTVTPGNNILTPGSFQPLQSFNGLVGCPIDGNWTLTITDNIGADDGFIFEWGIQLNPAITPNIEAYTVDMLSGVWLPHADIINDYDTLAIAYPSVTGANDYTFQVADEFGCTFDTIITVTSLPELVVTTLDTTINCGNQFTLPLEILGSTSSCVENVSISGQDDATTTIAQLNSFPCVPSSGVISAITLDATIGNFCGANSWYTYDIIINGVTQFTQQCDQTGLDLIPFLPITSVAIDANDEDNFSDNVTLDLTLNITYSDYPYAYAWTPSATLNDSTLKTPIASPFENTDYVITILDTNHGCLGYDTASVFVINSTATFDSLNTTCFDGNDGKLLVEVNGVGGPYTVEYFDTLGTLLQTNNTAQFDSLTNLTTGTYMVKVTDFTGCPIWDTLSINQPTQVVINSLVNDTTICIDGTVLLYGSAIEGTGSTTLIWDHGLVGSGPHNTIPSDSLTIYYVYGQDSLGCVSETDSVVVNWTDSIRVSELTSDTLCQDGVTNTTPLTALATGGNGSSYTYAWYDGLNNLIGTTQTINANPSTSPETFTVVVGDGCTSPTDSTQVDIYLFPIFQPTFDTTVNGDYCIPVDITFNNTTNPAYTSSVFWDFGDGTTSTQNTSQTHTYNKAGTYDVSLIITSSLGCEEDTISIGLVTTHSFPVPNFSYSPTNPTTLNTEIEFENLSTDNASNFWSFTDGVPNSSVDENPIVTYPTDEAGTYPVQLIVVNEFGCADTTTGKFVEVDGVYLMYVPNSFTPNDDGLNESFRAYGNDIELDDYTLSVFDRWGNLLFQSSNLENGWDGTHKGKPVPNGVYIWKIRAKEKYSAIIHKDWGSVTLTR